MPEHGSAFMSDKLRLLRRQAAAYLQDAQSAEDDRAAARLLMLAVQCQERILELEGQMGSVSQG